MEQHQQPGADPRQALTPTQAETSRRNRVEGERAAAALAQSVGMHESQASAALGESDAARGRSYEANGLGDIGLATAEWAAAYGLDGLAAEEQATALRARAAAARAQSVTTLVPPSGRLASAVAAAPAVASRGATPQRTR
jgi:hypothetical protein